MLKLLNKFWLLAPFLLIVGCADPALYNPEAEIVKDDVRTLKAEVEALKKANKNRNDDLFKDLFPKPPKNPGAGRGAADDDGSGKFFEVFEPGQITDTFENVAGMEQAKEDLREIIDSISDPVDFARLGARAPKGVIFYGPPGTGKTQIARAMAGEVGKNRDVTFIVASGAAFENKYVGVSADRVSELFEYARAHKPAIIFIDEFDAVAGKKSEEKKNAGMVNKLLTELDGFDKEKSKDVYLIAATNYLDTIEPAVMRAGRIDKKVEIGFPDEDAREGIINYYLAEKPVPITGIDVAALVKNTKDWSAADLKTLINIARRVATKRKAPKVEQEDIDAAFAKANEERLKALAFEAEKSKNRNGRS